MSLCFKCDAEQCDEMMHTTAHKNLPSYVKMSSIRTPASPMGGAAPRMCRNMFHAMSSPVVDGQRCYDYSCCPLKRKRQVGVLMLGQRACFKLKHPLVNTKHTHAHTHTNTHILSARASGRAGTPGSLSARYRFSSPQAAANQHWPSRPSR